MSLIENNLEDLKSIFHHEFGHFVAFNLSSKHISGFDIREMKITRCPLCKNGFGGCTKPQLPKGYKNYQKLNSERLAHVFSNNYLGCIFQIILSNSDDQLDDYMLDYGQLDQKSINHFLNQYELISKTHEINDHFRNLCNSMRGKFKNPFYETDYYELFVEENDEISINLIKLKELSKNFIKKFEHEYFDNIASLKKIIE
ncbi:hypothetical protein [Epilithonimonas sp.]|uniref:hypothetical protein n=1 Tax=Epilithonimonas sp. TaxID=2894511 RepID=UPI002898F834|nr:hypothetical protein [Epilithonimonas sp.]